MLDTHTLISSSLLLYESPSTNSFSNLSSSGDVPPLGSQRDLFPSFGYFPPLPATPLNDV